MSKLAEVESPADSHPSESGCGRWFQESPHPPQTPKSADAPVLKCLTEKVSTRDLPGGPVVRTPHSQYRGAGLRSRTPCSAVKKANNERAVQSPSSCWVCACSQRHTLWVSQGAEPLGLSRMSLLHPNPRLRDRFGDSRLHRLQTPVCARAPPQGPRPPERAFRKPAATLLAEVVHQDDLLQEGPGRRIQDAVHGPQEGGPGLVVEAEDDAGGGQAVRGRWLLQAPAGRRGGV